MEHHTYKNVDLKANGNLLAANAIAGSSVHDLDTRSDSRQPISSWPSLPTAHEESSLVQYEDVCLYEVYML